MIERLEVPQEVIEHVKNYLTGHDLGELVEVMRASDCPDDDYLYMVIARKVNINKYFHNGEYDYSCWTSWNETTQSLNFGHYHLKTVKSAEEICAQFFHKIN